MYHFNSSYSNYAVQETLIMMLTAFQSILTMKRVLPNKNSTICDQMQVEGHTITLSSQSTKISTALAL